MPVLPDWVSTTDIMLGLSAGVLSLLLNLWAGLCFMSRSLRAKKFMAGRWHGTLSNELGSLDCTAVFYEENGQLSGHIYYEGSYGDKDQVRGFDKLYNDSRHFIPLSRPLLASREFRICCHRAVHSFKCKEEEKTHIYTKPEPYEYHCRVHTRFKNPRLTAMVTTRDDEAEHSFYGELTKA